MTSEMKNPGAGDAGAWNTDLACLLNVSEHTTAPDPVQAHRVAWIMRHLPVDAGMPHAVASVAFSASEVR